MANLPDTPTQKLVPDGWALTPRGMSCNGEHALDNVHVWLDTETAKVVIQTTSGLPPENSSMNDMQAQVLRELLDELEAERSVLMDEWVDPDAPRLAELYEQFELLETAREELNVVDLAEVMENGAPEREMLIPELLVRGTHHLVYGPKEQGKTWLALWTAVQVLEGGECVLWVDKEMGRADIANRLVALGASVEAVREHLTYVEHPLLDGSKDSRKNWFALLGSRSPALLVIDAQTEVLADAGLNENNNTDIGKWMSWYLVPAQRLGVTTVFLDHVPHDGDRARGGTHKGNAAKVELLVTATNAFSRDVVGTVKVERRKNTLSADIPREQWLRIGGAPFVLEPCAAPLGKSDGDDETPSTAFVRIRRVMLELLRQDGSDWLSGRQLKESVRGNEKTKRDVLLTLSEEPGVEMEPGKQGGWKYRWAGVPELPQ